MAEEERFQTYSEGGEPLALVPRSQVHAQGLWHKAVQVIVYRSDGRMLLQQRSANKDLHPLHWDSSVGEHLQPNESYAEGAVRGLREELAIELTIADLTELGAEQRLKLVGDGYQDFEMQMAFHCQYDGTFTYNDEVLATRWVDRDELGEMLEDRRCRFTPWFGRHLTTYELLNSLS